MSETPRMVIVPAKVTEEMAWAWDQRDPIGNRYIESQGDLDQLVKSSPNAGKISRADLERAMQAADGAHSRSPGTPDQLERAWQDAFCATLGLEIAEDESHD